MFENKEQYLSKIENAASYISKVVCDSIPEICIVLGSGLSPLADYVSESIEISYSTIPGFPLSTAPGHSGKLVVGTLSGKRVFLMSGRFHYYEGYDISVVTFYVRVMSKLGVKTLLLTNAAGGINENFELPSLMVIEDHLSFFLESPLRGPNLSDFGTRFPDQSHVYDKEYISIIKDSAKRLNINLSSGIYAYSKGPQYETPAEIRALRLLGASAVGMSTVPEAIVATHSGIRTVAISCITNLAAGLSSSDLNEQEVIDNANKATNQSVSLVKDFIARI